MSSPSEPGPEAATGAQAKRELQTLRLVVMSAAHQLNNIMSGLLGYADLEQDLAEGKASPLAQTVIEQCDRGLGLSRALMSGKPIRVFIVDTQVYSNTGGQASKATPMGAVAKFAASGKPQMKKDLGMMSMTYGNIYVAAVAMGASPVQTVKAFVEAEAYDGPSIIIAYSHCIAHGINMTKGMAEQKRAVQCGHFPLYRYNPDLAGEGKNPLTLDSKPPVGAFSEFAMGENRFRILQKSHPERAKKLMEKADRLVKAKYEMYARLAEMAPCNGETPDA